MNKNVLIINTGGTISSIKTPSGYQPEPGFVEKALLDIPALTHNDMPKYDILEYQPLLDSSNMTVQEWNSLGKDIAENYDRYDGFIIFHGTDTMAYTASALSFMLEHLGKPVIITGSQIPLSEVRSDALDNIITSLWLCVHRPIPEVCIYFNQRLLRGNRSQKMSAQQFYAFDSPNFPHLADVGIDITVRDDLILNQPSAPFHLQTIKTQFIANFRLFPGFVADVLNYILSQPIDGLIIETFGAGNAQNNDKTFLKTLHDANKRGIILVNCTQCAHGRVEMSQYATGHTLRQAGLISGHDMTPEAAHCKLLYLLNKGLNQTEIKSAIEQNLCGELSLN